MESIPLPGGSSHLCELVVNSKVWIPTRGQTKDLFVAAGRGNVSSQFRSLVWFRVSVYCPKAEPATAPLSGHFARPECASDVHIMLLLF
jgi:hypothetical protein